MADRMSRKEKVEQALSRINEGTKEFFSTDRYKDYLRFLGKFHSYSLNNCILIARQKPDAGRVAGYNDWKKKFHRNVKRGEQGIMILAPFKGRREVETGDIDINGNPEKKEVDYIYFQPVYVFDESQTEGEPLPELVSRLDYEVKDFERIRDALLDITDCSVTFGNIDSKANGYYKPMDHSIRIREGMSNAHTLKTLVHEIVHSMLHRDILSDKSSSEKEIEAESTAFIVCDYLGFDTSEYSFGYVATWAEGKDISELKECLDNIKSASNSLIDALNDRLGLEISSEQGAANLMKKDVEDYVKGAGISADQVVLTDFDLKRRDMLMYVYNQSGTYAAEFRLHGEPDKLKKLLENQNVSYEYLDRFLVENDISCEVFNVSANKTYDFMYDYERKNFEVLNDINGSIKALVAVEGKNAADGVFCLNDAMPVMGGRRVIFTAKDLNREEADYTDRISAYENMGYDDRWPMVQVVYSNIPGIRNEERNIYELQTLIRKQPDSILNNGSKYLKVRITYTMNDYTHETVQDIDMGRGRVNYLDHLNLPEDHRVHLSNHTALLAMCDMADSFAPETSYGQNFADRMYDWAQYCRMELNHNSSHPVIPKPPEVNDIYTNEFKEWRMER